MKQEQLDHFKRLLLELKPHLREEIERRVQVLPEEVVPPGEPWQQASEALDDELAVENVQEQLYERISNALFRIDEGTFGCCLGCGGEIDLERLEAVPYAEYCVQCERRHESA
jgi:RNA polymerase-binding protein DksA